MPKELVITPPALVKMCHDCARNVYGTRPPTMEYALRVTRLMAGTAATESHLRYQRQGGFSLENIRGAWGIFQTESGALQDTMARLQRDDALRANAERWLFQGQGGFKALFQMDPLPLLQLVHDWHRLAALVCRLHYYRFPAPVPGTDTEQAAYYKKHYNTYAPTAAGSVEKYLRDFHLVRDMLDVEARMWRMSHGAA